MGIERESAIFFLQARREGHVFGRTLTIGRQRLFVSAPELARLAASEGFPASSGPDAGGRDAEAFLTRFLDASEVLSLDYSSFEGASITHDLNSPVPQSWHQTFDTVIDGGTLEHLFDVPTALANYMRLLRPGGRLFLHVPANNQLGHGFYQFSPELLYRALDQAHGFTVESMQVVQFNYVATEVGARGVPLAVIDPAELGTRTVVSGRYPASLLARARKLRHLDQPFATPPQQSDYVTAWKGESQRDEPSGVVVNALHRLWRRLPPRLKWKLWNEYGRRYRNTLRNRRWFRPL
jgi:SAM-dependent methyltransferase